MLARGKFKKTQQSKKWRWCSWLHERKWGLRSLANLTAEDIGLTPWWVSQTWRYLKTDLEVVSWIKCPIDKEDVLKAVESPHSNIYLITIELLVGVSEMNSVIAEKSVGETR